MPCPASVKLPAGDQKYSTWGESASLWIHKCVRTCGSQVSLPGVFLAHSPLYCVRLAFSLTLELTD